jgi:glucokinase
MCDCDRRTPGRRDDAPHIGRPPRCAGIGRVGYKRAVSALVPVLEVGGTHVSAALVDPEGWRVGEVTRDDLDADAPGSALLERFCRAAGALRARSGSVWGVAMPDPFDYERGIGQFEGVGKFTGLRGVDVGDALAGRLRGRMAFLNDADAFLLGEWAAGAARGTHRCVGITLGTGIGSAWLVDGVIVDPGTPPGGRLHRMTVGGLPLEDVVSRRAIRRAYADAGGDPAADVREIADAASGGSRVARRVLDAAMTALGRVVGRCAAGFRADVLVIGGSMSASWELFEPAFRAGALGNGLPRVRLAADSDHAPLIGAAVHAVRHAAG